MHRCAHCWPVVVVMCEVDWARAAVPEERPIQRVCQHPVNHCTTPATPKLREYFAVMAAERARTANTLEADNSSHRKDEMVCPPRRGKVLHCGDGVSALSL